MHNDRHIDLFDINEDSIKYINKQQDNIII